jgi:hypothetical protein
VPILVALLVPAMARWIIRGPGAISAHTGVRGQVPTTASATVCPVHSNGEACRPFPAGPAQTGPRNPACQDARALSGRTAVRAGSAPTARRDSPARFACPLQGDVEVLFVVDVDSRGLKCGVLLRAALLPVGEQIPK